jgi:hypothetical protein
MARCDFRRGEPPVFCDASAMTLRRFSSAACLVVALSLPGLGCSDAPAASTGSGGSASSGSGGQGGDTASTSTGDTGGTATGGTGGTATGGSGGTGGTATGGSSGTATGGGGGTGGSGSTGSSGGTGGSGGGVPLDGFGAISGACGIIDAMEIQSDSPFVFRDTIDFGMDVYDYAKLSPGGKVIYDNGNLGGSSLESEIISYEVLYRCELAELLKTEAEIIYQSSMGKKTDLLVTIDAFKVGVSVTRAYGFPPDAPYTEQQAHDLLLKKLSDIQLSSANVDPVDGWEKQILHVIAYTQAHADTMELAYASLDASVRADTILLLTVSEGSDEFIY